MISIIIPVYNVKPYLDECLQSVVQQNYADFECILVDDGSTDGSELICDEWGLKDTRFRVVHQDNQGVSVARNRGLEEAKGEFIAFIDSDDRVEKSYLEDMITPMLQHQVDLVVSGLIQQYQDGTFKSFVSNKVLIAFNECFTKEFVDLNRKYLLFGPYAKLYKSCIIQNYGIQFPLEYSYGEDLIFNYRYLNYIYSLYVTNRINYNYRILGSGTLSTKKRKNQFQIDYEQWNILRDFFSSHRMLNTYSSAYLYDRLWWSMYDAICAAPMILSEETFTAKVRYIRKIFDIKEWHQLMDYVQTLNIPFWFKFCVMHKKSVLLTIFVNFVNKYK